MTRQMERLTKQMITGNVEPTTREEVQRELERLWDLQQQDEWPTAKQRQIRDQISRLENRLADMGGWR